MGVNMHDSHVVVCKERTIKELPQNADQLLFQPMFVLLYEFLFFAGFIRKKMEAVCGLSLVTGWELH